MYAVIELGGKQYKVEQGEEVIVDRMDVEEGKSVTLVPLLLAGIAGRLALLWWLAKQFDSEVKSVTDFLQRWQYPIIIVSIAVVIISNLSNFRKGRG